jgi:hypothetical protein
MELVQASLFHYYDQVNIMVDYSGVEVYLHVFSAAALSGDVPLNSTFDK